MHDRRPGLIYRVVRAPSAREVRASVSTLAALLCAVGLATASWERLGNIPLGPYNVKLPVVVLSLAALLTLAPAWRRVRSLVRRSSSSRWVIVLAGAAVVLFALRAATSSPLVPGIAQLVAVLSGAVLPAIAVLGVSRDGQDLAWLMRWFIGGAFVASGFGLYQLLAFYTGLPQGIEYRGVGTSGAGGRISAFSYEPAYFAYFLILTIGVLIALAHLERRRVSWAALAIFALLLALANVRALLFVLPVLALLLATDWRRNRSVLFRGAVVGAAAFVIAATLPLALSSLDALASRLAPAGSGSSEAGSTLPSAAAPQLPSDVLDPSEPSSNGPRLDLYRAVLRVDLNNLPLGVGPGHLGDALVASGYTAPNQGPTVVANNIWLQAVADGGVLLLLIEAGVLLAVGLLWWRARRLPAHAAASALLAVLLVGGLLTSYFFDIKIWITLAFIVLLADTMLIDSRSTEDTMQVRSPDA